MIAKYKFGEFPVPVNLLNHAHEAKQAAKAAARVTTEAAAEAAVIKTSTPMKAVTKQKPHKKKKAADKVAFEPAKVEEPVNCAGI